MLSMSTNGKYICFSGGEGTGKTTVIHRLQTAMPDTVFVREPGGTVFGVTLRQLLLDRHYAPDPWTELFLLMADRMELYNRIVRPALAEGKIVVSDRCWVETLVYQILSKVGDQAVPDFLSLVKQANCPMPDLWLWFDLDPKIGLSRRHSTGEVNSFDADALEIHERYRQGFGKVATILPDMKMVKINAEQSRDEVFAAVQSAIMTIQNN